jgi:predicted choloylglycine hydrolase
MYELFKFIRATERRKTMTEKSKTFNFNRHQGQNIQHIDLAGDHFLMGQQHGYQVRSLKPLILAAIEERLTTLSEMQDDIQPIIEEISAIWEMEARPTMDMLRGIADTLSLDWEMYYRYTIAPYILDRIRYTNHHSQGCTTWAAAGPITRGGFPILAKNRDYRSDHQQLQCLVHAHPNQGYRYSYLTSAGSPGVFSSGMNEAGLVAADTHVSSLDVGPGLPRYATMMEILERHDKVNSALDYLQENQHTGNGTITLLDAEGDMAVYETGNTISGSIRSEEGFVVSTNHFVSPQLSTLWKDKAEEKFRGNSLGRNSKVYKKLQRAKGDVDVPWAKSLMMSHGIPGEAICRHLGDAESNSTTISSILFLPGEKLLFLSNGSPCTTDFHTISLN